MKKKIFIGLSGGAGPMIRCLPVAIELKKRGYEIYYYSRDYSKHYYNMYGFHQVNVTYPKRYDAGLGTTEKWVDLEHFAATYENDYSYFCVKYNTWIKYMEELKPDLIISDFSLGSTISGLVLNIPIVSISQACYLYTIKNDKKIRWWDNSIKPKECMVLDNLNRFLKSHNINGYEIFEQIFLENKVFIPSIPEFDTLNSMDDKVEYVGPILWEGYNKSDIIERKSGKKIFVYLGRLTDTCGDTGILIYNIIKEIAQESNVQFILSNGNFDNIEDPGIENILVNREWLSVREIYTSHDLIIHHGGHNSCIASLVYGTPSIIIPTHTEREFNARNMENIGAGKMVLPERASGETTKKVIKELLENKIYKNKCLYYKEKIENLKMDGKNRIVEYITKCI